MAPKNAEPQTVKVYMSKHHSNPASQVLVGDQLPDKDGNYPVAISVCHQFIKQIGLDPADFAKFGKVLELEITVNQTATYGLNVESPWKKKD